MLPSPEEAAAYNWSDYERMVARAGRSRHFIGTPDKIMAQIDELPHHLGCRSDRDDDDPRSPRARAIVRTARDGQSAARGPRPAIRSGRFGRLAASRTQSRSERRS